MITLNVVAVLCRTWSLRPRLCPPCPRLPPQTVWVTWATSRTVCRAWFPHCRDRTLTCPPNNPTCQASSPCINRSAIMLTSLQTSYEPLCFFTCFNILILFCFLLGAPSWWPSATAAAPATAAGSSGSTWQRRGTAHLLRLIATIPQAPDTLHPLPSSVLALTLSGLWGSPPETHTPPSFLLWCCGNVNYCDDVAELLLSLPPLHRSVGGSHKRELYNPDSFSPFPSSFSWYVCSISLLND